MLDRYPRSGTPLLSTRETNLILLVDEGLTIPLRRRDGSIRAWAVVDTEDHASLAANPWCLSHLGYAVRKPKQKSTILMHREVMGLKPGDPRHLDHHNRDRLDNRKANLRFATRAEQMQNLSANRASTSRFRGVWWNRHKGCWEAGAQINGTQKIWRGFADEVEAARVVDAWRLEHMPYAQPDPELAKINR